MPDSVALETPIGTNQYDWQSPLHGSFCTFSGTAPNPGSYNHVVTLPTTNATNGVFVLTMPRCNQIVMRFWGVAATGTFAAYVYGLRTKKLPWVSPKLVTHPYEEYGGIHLGTLTPTLGAGGVDAATKDYPLTAVFGESIAETTDVAFGGWTIFGNGTAGAANAIADITGYSRLVVVLKLGSATGMGFDWAAV